MSAPPDLAAATSEGLALIRARQRRMGYILWALVPFVLAAACISALPSPAALETAFILAALAYGILLLAYSLRLAFTECPRCQNLYHCNWWMDPWAKRCLHCGLQLKVQA